MEKKDKTIQIRLSKEEKKALEDICGYLDVTKSTFVRDQIREFVSKNRKKLFDYKRNGRIL